MCACVVLPSATLHSCPAFFNILCALRNQTPSSTVTVVPAQEEEGDEEQGAETAEGQQPEVVAAGAGGGGGAEVGDVAVAEAAMVAQGQP